MVRQAAMIADYIFNIETDVIEEEVATQQQVDLVTLMVQDFYDLMKVIDERVGMEHDVKYMDGHIEKISSYLV